MRKCMTKVEDKLEQKVHRNFTTAMKGYVECIENEGRTCDAPMLQHNVAHLKVFQQYLKGKQGKDEMMLEKVALPD